MKRYIATIIFSGTIILLYQFVNVNFFSFDLPKRISNHLFNYFNPNLRNDKSVVMCNVGQLSPEEVVSKIDLLLKYNPQIVGINICDLPQDGSKNLKHLSGDGRVVLGNCNQSEKTALGRIVDNSNTVTHFNSDNHDCFEAILSNNRKSLYARGNKSERINFISTFRNFYQFELKDIESHDRGYFENQIILVGYIGDYITEEVYNYKSCRITPLNQYYGNTNILPDMYDIQISANIISMINNEEYFNEINPLLRVLIILAICLLNVGLITIIQTKWMLLNLVIHIMVFILLLGAGAALIVILFSNHYYLEINELTLVLLITSIFTIASNIKNRKTSPQ